MYFFSIRFATRAKKIENKPIVNEVVSDAVEVKRMRKQIVSLEAKLSEQKKIIDEVDAMRKELEFLHKYSIQATKMVPIPQPQRRKTWCGDFQSMLPMPAKSENTEIKIAVPIDSTACNGNSSKTQPIDLRFLANNRGSCDLNNGSDIAENEWRSSSEVFKMPRITEDAESTPPITGRKNKFRKSLLTTPKSLKNLMNRITGALFFLEKIFFCVCRPKKMYLKNSQSKI